MELTIDKLHTHMFTEGMSNVVTKVEWTATEGGVTVTGATRLNPPKQVFTPFQDLTDEMVKSWVMTRLDLARVRGEMQAVNTSNEKAQMAPPWSDGFEYVEPEHITVKRQTHEYLEATARLEQYVLADGRDEVKETVAAPEMNEETGEMEEVMIEVVVVTEIEPLPAEVEQPVLDEETGEQTGVEMVKNPAIVKDEQERAAAQAVVDATPQSIKESV
jgi:hypothetical protein